MKKIFAFLVVFVWFVESAYAIGVPVPPIQVINNTYNKTVNKTYVDNTYVNQESDYEAFDYGAYLNLIALETKNSEWGVLGTYAVESQESRVYVGGKVYLNRLFK